MNIKPLIAFATALVLTTAMDEEGCGGDSEPEKNTVNLNNSAGNISNGNDANNENNDVNNTPINNVGINNSNPNPFSNDMSTAIGALPGMQYLCTVDKSVYTLAILADGTMRVYEGESNDATPGTWTADGEAITIAVHALSFQETSTELAVDLDVVSTFATPSLLCHATALNLDPIAETEVLFCDNNEFQSMELLEDNKFTLTSQGTVTRERWEELLSVPDTLYTKVLGVFKVHDDTIYMVFGGVVPDDAIVERNIVATQESAGYRVAQFSHPDALCEYQ